MTLLRKITAILNAICEKLEKIANFICVFCLTMQTILICILVIGRYIFKFVPPGTEELAVLCMVWTALLSMVLSIRDDSHLKMELVDLFVAPPKIKYFQVISGILTVTLAVFMLKYGIPLWKLRWGTTMTSIKMSNAWYYAVIPLAGVLIGFCGVAFTLNSIVGIVDDKLNPENEKEYKSFKEAQAAQEILANSNESGKETE